MSSAGGLAEHRRGRHGLAVFQAEEPARLAGGRREVAGVTDLDAQLAVVSEHQVPGQVRVRRRRPAGSCSGPSISSSEASSCRNAHVAGEAEAAVAAGLGPRAARCDRLGPLRRGQAAQRVLPGLVRLAGVVQVAGRHGRFARRRSGRAGLSTSSSACDLVADLLAVLVAGTASPCCWPRSRILRRTGVLGRPPSAPRRSSRTGLSGTGSAWRTGPGRSPGRSRRRRR